MTALWASLCLLTANAQTVTQTMYVDFGEPNVSTRGNKTEGADVNGHYWNNVVSSGNNYLYPGTTFSLVNSSNVDTGYQILVNVRFTTNGMSGGGGLTSPSADLLGDMAIATATQDYIFLEANQHHNFITFKGLRPAERLSFLHVWKPGGNTRP
jgi:cephalosporin-C deacetylase-like acetyl esterase